MTQIDDLPPLREVITQHGLKAKKSLGQNFLLDLNLTLKIAKVAGPLEGVTVIEVGPGPGGLTRALLSCGAKKVIAVEKDARAIAALREISAHYPARLEIIEGDALEFDAPARLRSEPARIIANLPYNIATPLLIGWLTKPDWPPWYDSMTLMFQKEVAQRITASPGNKTYGRLSVLAQALCDVKIAFDVHREAFVPSPKITSSVVWFRPKPEAQDVPREALQNLTRAAFGQRRRMLRASLKTYPGAENALKRAEIDPTKRAEALSPSDFCRLSQILSNSMNHKY
jgi:16S rRNA (adenine1518-N6/adenine1519-N6)-dimethyltransferase